MHSCGECRQTASPDPDCCTVLTSGVLQEEDTTCHFVPVDRSANMLRVAAVQHVVGQQLSRN
jgi:hypothetical protein